MTDPRAPDPKPEPPEWPGDDACCGSGCDPCVLDFYSDDLQRYRVALKAWEERQAAATVAAPARAAGDG